ncbi:c-type cytochrome [Lentisphaera profundi]|uniref:C-type cytochrome n=1 Tax=Lentisphaera profundi TaxID=1658616 RepID=A0ABY7VX67_9BACT|nr:c-type cytochrome [Lentisphaera profundi]WDE98790.1 c-type cytochrome [Lentisphaera profundi]
MKQTFIALTFFLLSSCQSPQEFNQLSQNTQNQIQQCNNCHSKGQSVGAPSLLGLEEKYINAQVKKYKLGIRGNSSSSKEAIAMGKAILHIDEYELKQINRWFAHQQALKSSEIKVTHKVGQELYEQKCYGCHEGSIGKFFTGSPSLQHLESWYIVKQCQDFMEGRRGNHPDDKKGRKMAERIKQVSMEELREIATFLAN